MDKQHIYNQVKAHIIAQGRPATNTTNGMCEYLTTTGLMCAIGALIPVHKRTMAFNTEPLGEVIEELDYSPEDDYNFFGDLQRAHDAAIPATYDDPEETDDYIAWADANPEAGIEVWVRRLHGDYPTGFAAAEHERGVWLNHTLRRLEVVAQIHGLRA